MLNNQLTKQKKVKVEVEDKQEKLKRLSILCCQKTLELFEVLGLVGKSIFKPADAVGLAIRPRHCRRNLINVNWMS